MLKIIQIVALLQGLFILFIFYRTKKKYKKATFWLFFGSIVSILLYIIGSDDNNLFIDGADWFLFDSSLFLTFLFLYFKYFRSDNEVFLKRDYLFFLPSLFSFLIETLEIVSDRENDFLEIIETLIEFVFLGYLIYVLYNLLKTKRANWILYFVVPIVLIMSISYINGVLDLVELAPIVFSDDDDFNTYLLLVVAFLFYFITFYFISKPKELIPNAKINKYKSSNLKPELIEKYKNALIQAMEKEKLFVDSRLSIHEVSKKLNIPRQYISEVLNLHLEKSFQDFVNEYRVEAFVKNLKNDQYDHFTLFGMATEVGFSSKSTFNATFKKVKGITPTQFKNSIAKKKIIGAE
ncbi:AraC-like DNA-binding protein [Gillisia sp. Hel_I_86]|uniref:helix-turn-helix domain-containing protein n=1 Tax=Gillisia sp. Hel_I_86 TaxID=1249981 RepID=UPI00119BCE29|nr:helix-turn-helix domain-containing protein [Gillisia sp. Hel_I_86]TVZ28665.1 AraC-like DNA-binding protein [Gillisia sp. Hel_I_86]